VSRADVVVIGAGVMGAIVAWYLTTLGVRDVALVDAGAAAGAGSTGRATGGYRARYASAINVRLSLRDRTRLLGFRDETGGDCGYQPVGHLFLATSEAELAVLGRMPGLANLYAINGSSGHGVIHAPVLGELLAEIIVHGEARSLDVGALRHGRFAEGQPNPAPVLL